MRALRCLLLLLWATASASPSAFPENAASIGLGYGGAAGGFVGAEVRLPLPILDTSVGLEAYAPVSALEDWRARLSGSALIIPAFGTTPPLALGLGTDVGFGVRGFSAHLGLIAGSDLLFSLDLPMTVSLYLAPGYARETGLSLAWAGQLRYYLDDVAFELASSDLVPLSLSVRILF